MSVDWNEDGENHEDCINECLYATCQRLRRENAALRRCVEAADAMRCRVMPAPFCTNEQMHTYDAARAELAKLEESE